MTHSDKQSHLTEKYMITKFNLKKLESKIDDIDRKTELVSSQYKQNYSERTWKHLTKF